MALYIGKEVLLAKRQDISRLTDNMKKGLTGEIEVGDLLSKYLPDDTYLISHPVIGKFEPDFLVVSPRYGFVIIEVKNWSLEPIKSASSNGTFQILDNIQNPFAQIRKHIEDLSGYLLSNHPDIKEPYRLIGCAVIQYGFNKQEFVKRFNIDKSWNPDQARDYFKFNLFKDQLDQNIDSLLMGTFKYPFYWAQMPSHELIKNIVSKISLSNTEQSEVELELLQKTRELDDRTNQLIQKTEELDIRVNTFDKASDIIPVNKPSEKPVESSNNVKFVVAFVTLILFLILFKNTSLFTKETIPDQNIINGNINSNTEEISNVPGWENLNDTGPEGQTVKGNINSKGEKIYHVPGGQYYDKTNPEEWFFSEEEAQSAGYRNSQL